MEENKEKLFEQLSGLAKKSQLFDILIAVEYSKLFIGDDSTIMINEFIPNYNRIAKFFEANNLSFESCSPGNPPSRFDVHFGKGIDFQDLFILTAILKIFGLQSIFYSSNSNGKIFIGSYITEATNGSQKKANEGLSVDDLLLIPFHTELDEFLKNHMNIDIENEQIEQENEDDYEDYDDYEEHDYYDGHDYDRDTFDALTDGQLGDYDDFGGDIDDVMTWLGR